MSVRRVVSAIGFAGSVILGGVVVAPLAASASTSNPTLAQVELSANCDNAALCGFVGGTGGIWFWTSIEANNTGDLSGASCGHTVGGIGGPGGAGSGSIQETIAWTYTTLEAAPQTANFFGTTDATDSYYLISGPGIGQWVVPTVTGHYSVKLAVGIQIQITVAP